MVKCDLLIKFQTESQQQHENFDVHVSTLCSLGNDAECHFHENCRSPAQKLPLHLRNVRLYLEKN